MKKKKRTSPELPEEFKKYFWDVDFKKLSFKEYKEFIAGRIIHFGNLKAIKWLIRNAGIPFIREVAKTDREMDKKSRNFWAKVYAE